MTKYVLHGTVEESLNSEKREFCLELLIRKTISLENQPTPGKNYPDLTLILRVYIVN